MFTYHELVRRFLSKEDYHQNRYSRALDTFVAPGCRWLDLGAGTGLHGGWGTDAPSQLASRCAQLVGCDLESEHLARNSDLSAAVVADGLRLPFRAQSFDLVTANMVVEHLDEPASVFREVRRVLKPKGTFLIVTPNKHHPAVFAVATFVPRRWRNRLLAFSDNRSSEHVFPTYYKANSRGSLERLASKSNLRLLSLDRFFSYPTIRRPATVTVAEILFIKTCSRFGLNFLGSNIVAAFRREP